MSPTGQSVLAVDIYLNDHHWLFPLSRTSQAHTSSQRGMAYPGQRCNALREKGAAHRTKLRVQQIRQGSTYQGAFDGAESHKSAAKTTGSIVIGLASQSGCPQPQNGPPSSPNRHDSPQN